MSNMRHAARQLAAQGRFGDSMLIHVSPAEVEGIASLIPGGLTINPQTGLPEAFFFLPFLASLFGAAAPAAAAATAAAAPLAAGAGAAGLGALGASSAAMTAGTLAAATPAIAAAAPVAAAAPAATLAGAGGVNSLIGGAGVDAITTGAIGAPGIAATLPATMAVPTAGAPAAASAMGAGPANILTTAGGGGFAGAPTAAPAMGAGSSNILTTAGGGVGATSAAPATAVEITPTFTPGVTPFTAPKTGIGGLFEKMGGWKNMPLWLTGASAVSNALGGLFAKKDKKKKSKDISGLRYSGGAPSFPGSDYSPGISGEHNYFPNYQYANGGIVTLADGGMVDPQMQPPQDMSFPMNGVPAGAGSDEAPMLEDIPSSPYPSSQIGAEPEPPAGETAEPTTHNDRELIAQTVEAIQGKVADPGPILLAFVQEFGEPALQDLATRVKAMPQGGGPAGPNDGQSDSIPALIDGQQPAALSEGEFVVPADAVSGLGNGSTDAGAQQLQGMVDGVRQMRTGGAVQPPAINPREVMPYAEGGLVSLFKKGGKVKAPERGGMYMAPPMRANPMYMAPPMVRGGMYMAPPTERVVLPETAPIPVARAVEPAVHYNRSEAVWDGIEPDEMQGYGGNYTSWIVPPGTEPRSSRMPMIYRDYNNPPEVRPEIGQSQEWVDNIKAYQRAMRDLAMDAQGLPTSYGKNVKK